VSAGVNPRNGSAADAVFIAPFDTLSGDFAVKSPWRAARGDVRRAEEVSLLIREAFLRGISTRQVGRVVATVTGETVSAQTVSKLTRDLDEAVRQFHQARLSDDYAYLFLDGVSLRVRRPAGRKQVQILVAYGIRRDGRRHLLTFLRSQGEGQADRWL
jgi:transposase-like protein